MPKLLHIYIENLYLISTLQQNVFREKNCTSKGSLGEQTIEFHWFHNKRQPTIISPNI